MEQESGRQWTRYDKWSKPQSKYHGCENLHASRVANYSHQMTLRDGDGDDGDDGDHVHENE